LSRESEAKRHQEKEAESQRVITELTLARDQFVTQDEVSAILFANKKANLRELANLASTIGEQVSAHLGSQFATKDEVRALTDALSALQHRDKEHFDNIIRLVLQVRELKEVLPQFSRLEAEVKATARVAQDAVNVSAINRADIDKRLVLAERQIATLREVVTTLTLDPEEEVPITSDVVVVPGDRKERKKSHSPTRQARRGG